MHADHPFDAKRYAFELFSEDETFLSRYAGKLSDEEMEALLTKSWADLDSAAAKSESLPPEEAKRRIQAAVHGDGGIADQFKKSLSEKASASKVPLAVRLSKAVRHPAAWALGGVFLLAVFFLNRRRA